MTEVCETSTESFVCKFCFEIEPIIYNEAEEDGIQAGVVQYYWSAISELRPGSSTRPPTFCLLKAHCAPIMLGLQGRRTDEAPLFFLPDFFFLKEITLDSLGDS
jgi:hypothetical protein